MRPGRCAKRPPAPFRARALAAAQQGCDAAHRRPPVGAFVRVGLHLQERLAIALHHKVFRRHFEIFGQRQRHRFRPPVRQGKVVGGGADGIGMPLDQEDLRRAFIDIAADQPPQPRQRAPAETAATGLSPQDVKMLEATLAELLECKRLLDQAG